MSGNYWWLQSIKGKNLSFCLFKSCSHQEFLSILQSLTFLIIAYQPRAVNSVHNLATRFDRRGDKSGLLIWKRAAPRYSSD